MSKRILFASAVWSLVSLAGGAAYADQWSVDPDHSTVGFVVRHMAVSNVRGKFKTYTGTIDLDDKNPANNKIEVSIDTASVDTDADKRDEHLRSPDFFDSQKFPKMTFKSTKVTKKGKGYEVQGTLTIRDVTKPVTLHVTEVTAPAKNPWGKMVRGASASTVIDRYDYGLKWNKAIETGGVVVDQKVKIELDLELVKI